MPDSQRLEVLGTSVEVAGRPPGTLLFIHGWPDTARLWDAQVAALQDRWRCARFTLPGYTVDGPRRRVTLDDLVALVGAIADAVSPHAPLTLVLHDWGCVLGYEFAQRQPQRVARIVGLDIGDAGQPAWRRSQSARQLLMVVAYQNWLAQAWRFGGATGQRMTRWMARQAGAPAPPEAIGWPMNHLYHLAWTGGLRGLAPFTPRWPMLYVWGTRKPLMFHSPQWLAQVRATPGGHVQAWDSGHWVMCEDTDAFNALLATWLDDTAAAVPSGA